jgi:phage terminase large subunit-like protein
MTPEQIHRRHQYIRIERLRRERRKAEGQSIIHYLRRIWPWFVIEEVHLLMAGYIEALVFGAIDRYMQFLAPRAGKSMIGSIIAPSFYLGNFPGDKVMQASHQKELAVEFGREARDIIVEEDFRDIFLGVDLKSDAKAAGRWHTNKRGAYFAAGVTGGIAGKGWNFGSADDLLNEQTAYSDVANRKVLNWWGPGFYTRRQPDRSRLMLTTTRWRKGDIAGWLLENARKNPRADQYTVLRVPALIDEATAEILNEHTGDPLLTPVEGGKPIRYKAGDSFSPRRMSKDFLLRQRANMSSRAWDALYDQNPTDDEGAIIKRAWWRPYKAAKGRDGRLQPPQCLYVVQVYDTAFEEKEMGLAAITKKKTADPDFSARTTWGVFEHTDFNGIVRPCAILLERWKERVGFPELRRAAFDAYRKWNPNKVIIEKKASGHSLLQEMRRKKVPVLGVTIAKGASKTARAHAASVVPEQGCVFYMCEPSGLVDEHGNPMPVDWAKEVIDEVTDFPFGDYDDITDTCVHAWLWLRRTMWVELPGETRMERLAEEIEDEAAAAAQGERRLFG